MQGYVRKRRRSWAETCPRWAISIASLAQERKTVGVPCTGAGSHTDQSEAVPSIEQRSARSQRSWRVGRTDALSFYSALSDRSFLFLFFIPPPLIPNCSNAFSVITKKKCRYSLHGASWTPRLLLCERERGENTRRCEVFV